MKRIILLSFHLLFVFAATAQNTPNIIPPSPEAAALAKYGDVPVSLYTGTPNIEIPLYNLQCGSLNLPISLSYYAAGVKVEDISTWVGLGWVLNAGGVITRTIRGKAENVLADGKIFPTVSDLPIPTTNIGISDFDKVRNLATGAYETEPDVFYYNFNGRSGSFYFDKNGKPIIKKQEDIKIEYLYVSTYVSKFILTLEDGTKYYFEETTGNGETGDISTWYLTKIKDVNEKNTISFTYDTETYSSPLVPRFSKYYYFTSTTSPGLFLPKFTDPICENSYAKNKRLKRIDTSTNITVLLNPKNEIRQDVNTTDAKALEEIIVKNPDNKIIKQYQLITQNIQTLKRYLTKTDGYMCPDVTNNSVLNYRMYLEGIIEKAGSGEALPAHKFTYHGRSAANQDSLAHRLSAAQDWGGYYNGQDDNTDLLPGFSGYLNPALSSMQDIACAALDRYPRSLFTLPGSNRSMSLTYKKMGTIKTITYPTGGMSQFHFGSAPPNWEGVVQGGIRIDKIDNFDSDGKKVKSKKYNYTPGLPGYNLAFTGYTLYNPKSAVLSPYPLCSGSASQAVVEIEWNIAFQLSTGPTNDLGLFEGPWIGYDVVQEIEEGNGYTEYQYSNEHASEGEEIGLEFLAYSQDYVGSTSSGYTAGMDHRTFSQPGPYWPFKGNSDISWRRGTLIKKSLFDQSNRPVEETKYHYSFLESKKVPAIKVTTVKTDVMYIYHQFTYLSTWVRLDSTTETKFLGTANSVIRKHFEYGNTNNYGNNPLYLKNSNHKLLTKETTFLSDKSKRIVTTKYATDYDYNVKAGVPSVIKSMQNKHFNSAKIEEKELIERDGVEKQVSGKITLYQEDNGIKPAQILQTEASVPFTSSISGLDYDTGKLTYHKNYNPVVIYDKFDNKDNILQFHQKNGETNSFIWGYQQLLPIAKVINAPYNEIFYTGMEETGKWDGNVVLDKTFKHSGESAGKIANSSTNELVSHSTQWLTVSLAKPKIFKFSGWVYSTGPSAQIFLFMKKATESNYFTYVTDISTTAINKWVYLEKEYEVPADVTQLNIRLDNNGSGNVWFDDIRLHPANAQMSTYTYAPLVGITSVCDPNNYVTYYHYDAFNRLSFIKDSQGNIVKSYEYHYQKN